MSAVSSSILALTSTYHVALLLLRQHRSFPGRVLAPLLLPSLVLVAQPWFLPDAVWVAVGAAAHLLWFVACERLAPASLTAVQARPRAQSASPGPRPAAGLATHERPTAPPPRRDPFIRLPVLAVIDETHEIKTFRLPRPADLAFSAGQFVTVRVEIDGARHTRCYSISSPPEIAGFFEISVRRQGLVSALLHATVRPGSSLEVSRPAGTFVYPAGDQRPVVLLAGGIGVTPLRSMLHHGLTAEPERPITLLYAARTAAEMAFADELHVLARRHPLVTIQLRTTREAAGGPFHHGRIDDAAVAEALADPRDAIFMICGPTAMVDDLKRTLPALGIPAGQIRSEAFGAAPAPSPAVEPAVVSQTTTSDEPEPAGGGGAYRLTLALSDRTVTLGEGDTLLEAAEGAGADIPSSCRAGMCLTCRCRLLEGDVECDSDMLGEDERAEGYILPCVSRARTDCVLEA